MTFDDLIRVLPPPETPIANKFEKGVLKDSFGVAFPDEYFTFIENYGRGRVADTLFISSLECRGGKPEIVSDHLDYVGYCWNSNLYFNNEVIGFFPEQPGLILIGMSDLGLDIFYLVTEGDKEWKIAIDSGGMGIEVFDFGLIEFIYRLVTNSSPVIDLLENSDFPCVFEPLPFD